MLGVQAIPATLFFLLLTAGTGEPALARGGTPC